MIALILVGLVGVATVFYFYLSYNYNYWKRKGLPQPSTVFGFGNIWDAVLMKKNLGMIYDDIYGNYPDHDAVGVYGFYTPRLLLRSPELIQRVLVRDFSSFHDNEFFVTKKSDPHFYMDPFNLKGEEWKYSRAKLATTTTSTKVKEIYPLMMETISRLDAYLVENLGKDIEAKLLTTLFTMDNVSNSVFGISSNCFSDPDAAFRKMADIQMKEQLQVWWKTMVLTLMPNIRDLIGLKVVPTVVNSYVEGLVREVMEYRLKNSITRNDLFQYFMKKDTGNNVNDIMFYAMTFFIEGFETSSMVASLALYELAINPEVQETLYKELKAAFDDKTDFDYDTISSLPYLNKVVQESQRKYPVMYAYIRECTKPTTIEINGKSVDIEVRTPVIIPVFSIHRDPCYYPDPEVFDPERFNEENKASRPQYTFIPFGEGPRICPGIRFGLIQVKLFISHIIHKYKILCTDKTPPKLTFSSTSFLVVPNEEQWIKIEKRK